MYTERRAIEDELQTIRRQLDFMWNRKIELRLRLRELDERDMKLESKVSYDALSYLTDHLNQTIGKLTDFIPPVEVSQVLDHIAKDINPEQIIKKEEEAPKQEAAADKITKAAMDQQAQTKMPIKLSRERTSSFIKEILVDAGKPLKFKEIESQFYNRTNRRFANFYEQMRFAQEAFPNIKKIGRGLYTYEKPVEVEEKPINESTEETEEKVLQLQTV